MNATVITTGPGVIIETATASRNWRSVSQRNGGGRVIGVRTTTADWSFAWPAPRSHFWKQVQFNESVDFALPSVSARF